MGSEMCIRDSTNINALNQLNRRPRLLAFRRGLVSRDIKLAKLQNTQDFLFPLLSVLDVLGDPRAGVLNHRPVSGVSPA